MTLAALEAEMAEGDRVLLDTTTLIAHLNGTELASPSATQVIDGLVRPGRNLAIVSAISVMEVLVRPFKQSTPLPARHVRDFLRGTPHLECCPVDFDVAVDAAQFRAAYDLSTPDSLIIATGQVHQVSHLVTNDAQWKKKLNNLRARLNLHARLNVVYLGDFIPL